MNINDFLTCKFTDCNKYFENPIKLPCDNTICKEHIEKYQDAIFKCIFCNQEHLINDDNIKINQDILNVLNMKLHLNSKQLLMLESIAELDVTVNNMENITSNPFNFIFKSISKIRDDVNLRRDDLKKQIDDITNQMLFKLDEFESECKINIGNLDNEIQDMKKDINISKNKFSDYSQQVRYPNLDINKLDYLIRRSEQQVQENEDKLSDLKIKLLKNNEISFQKDEFVLEKNLFGRIKIDDLILNDIFKTCLMTISNAHSHIIDCVEIINSNTITTCSRDRRIKLWNMDNKVCIKTLEGHTDEVLCVKLVSESILASGSADMSIKIWDLNSFECIETLLGHTNSINCLCTTSNDQIISASRDRSIKLWNLNTSNCYKSLYGHTDDILCMLTFLNGYIITGSADKTIKVWSLSLYQTFKTLQGHTDNVTCLEMYSKDLLMSGSTDKTIRIWSIESGNCLNRIINDSRIRCLKLLPNDLLISGNNIYLKMWKLDESKSISFVKFIEGHMDTIFDVKLMPNLNLVSCSGDGCIKLWKY
jgi:WD40 repeat protein